MTKTDRINQLNADLAAGRVVIPRPVMKSAEPDNDRVCTILYAYRPLTQHPSGAGDGTP